MKNLNGEVKKIEDVFAPEGLKECEMKCDRRVVMTETGPVVVCSGCMRIVMDNRKSEK